MASSSSTASASCLVRGSLGIDEFFSVEDIVKPGQTISSRSYDRRPGGKGANQATAIAKAGGQVHLSGSIGPDGTWMLPYLRDAGVNVDSVSEVAQGQTGRAIIQLSVQGENSIVLFKGANHAITDPPPPSLFTSPTGPTHLVLQNEIPLPDTLAHLALAHAAGATTFFNPSPLPSDKELQTIEWAHIRWLVLNADEAASLLSALGEPFTDAPPVPKLPSTAAPALFASYAVAASLHAHPRLARATGIVCTLGASGVLALAPSLAQPVYVPGVLLPDGPVDTTGAGDCFTGYLVAGLMDLHAKGTALDEHTLRAVLTRCVRAAGMCCERRGAMESIPSAMEVDKRFGVEI